MKKYNVMKSFPMNGVWYHPGQKFPADGQAVDEALLKSFIGVYLLSDEDVAKRNNPEAFAKGTELEQANQEITRLKTQLAEQSAGDPTLSQLQALAPDDAKEGEGLVQVVTGWRDTDLIARKVEGEIEKFAGKVVTLTELPDYVAELKQGEAERAAELATLRALYVVETGTEIPTNFLRRGNLAPFGLTTYESLRGKTPEQLDAIEGITLDQAKKIVDLVDAHFEKLEAEAKAQADGKADAPAQPDAAPTG